MTVRVVHVTEMELRGAIASAFSAWPRLRDVDATDHCCPGCAATHAADLYGWPSGAVEAWERIEECRFLLGGLA